MHEYKQDQKSGLWCPNDRTATKMIKEAYWLSEWGGTPCIVDLKDKVVMDCGSHIGSFSARAIADDAKEIHAYEPVEWQLVATKRNLDVPHATVYEAALSTENGEASFFLRDDNGCSSSLEARHAGITKRFNYHEVKVKTLDFWQEIERIQPDVVKMDIEGAEWSVLTRPLPDCVKAFFFELHLKKSVGRTEETGIKLLEDAFPGAKLIQRKDCVVYGKVLNITGVYTR